MPISCFALAQGRLFNGDYEGAMATYRDVLALYPDNYTALLYLGNYCRDNGKDADALHYLRRAQALKPTPYVDEVHIASGGRSGE